MSCAVQNELTDQQKMMEDVQKTTIINRNIIGYENGWLFKNRVYYIVTDSEGNPAPMLFKPKSDTLRPIGDVFLLEEQFNYN